MVVSLVWWFACGGGGDWFAAVAVRVVVLRVVVVRVAVVRMVVGVVGGGEFLVWWLYVRL